MDSLCIRLLSVPIRCNAVTRNTPHYGRETAAPAGCPAVVVSNSFNGAIGRMCIIGVFRKNTLVFRFFNAGSKSVLAGVAF